jgi:hypothetical protein
MHLGEGDRVNIDLRVDQDGYISNNSKDGWSGRVVAQALLLFIPVS